MTICCVNTVHSNRFIINRLLIPECTTGGFEHLLLLVHYDKAVDKVCIDGLCEFLIIRISIDKILCNQENSRAHLYCKHWNRENLGP